MQFEIQTYRGISFTIPQTDLIDFAEKLNARELRTIAISNIVLNKQNIKAVSAIYSETETPVGVEYDIYTNENTIIHAHVENYDAPALSAAINDTTKQFVVIGDTLLNQNHVSMIAPTTTETPA